MAIANSIFITRLLGVVGKGEMAIFLASVGLWHLILGLGIDQAIRYFAASKRLSAKDLIVPLAYYTILVGILFFLIVHSIHSFSGITFFLAETNQKGLIEVVLALCVCLSLAHGYLLSILISFQEFRSANKITVLYSALSVIVHGTLLFFQYKGFFYARIEFIFVAHLTLLSINVWTALKSLRGFIPFKELRFLRIEMEPIRIIFKYSAVSYFAGIAQFLNYRIDFWLVENFLNVKSLGLYSLASNLSQMLWLLPKALSSVLLPVFASQNSNEWERPFLIGKSTFMICLLFGVIAIVLMRWLIPFLYGEEFIGSIPSFNILMIGSIPFCLTIVYASILGGKNELRGNMIASVVGLIATIILDVVLIPMVGIKGAAIASSVSYLLTTIILLYNVHEKSGLPFYSSFLLNNTDLKQIINLLRK